MWRWSILFARCITVVLCPNVDNTSYHWFKCITWLFQSGWLDKNSDTLHSSLEQLMLTSESSLVEVLYHDVADVKCNKKMVQDSVSTKFQVIDFWSLSHTPSLYLFFLSLSFPSVFLYDFLYDFLCHSLLVLFSDSFSFFSFCSLSLSLSLSLFL